MSTATLFFETTGKAPACPLTIDGCFHQSIGLEYVEQRAVELYEDGRRSILEGPCIWLTWPTRHYHYGPAPGYTSWLHRYIRFFGPRAQEWEQQGLLPFSPQPLLDGAAMGQRLDQIIDFSRSINLSAQLRAANLLEAVLLDLAEWRAARLDYPAWLSEVLSLLQAPEGGMWNETEFARRHGMSLVTLRRHFRRATGLPLHTYAIRARIQHARMLLEESALPLKAIAERLGYCDTYYFQQQFRQVMGITPSQYRKHLPAYALVGV